MIIKQILTVKLFYLYIKIKPLIFAQHRCHSTYLSFGGNMDDLIKELLGNLNESNILDKNGIIILHRNKKYKDLLPNKFNIELEKIYGLSKIIFGFF